MALSLCRWNPWFNPQQSGHCYPLSGALQSGQLSKRDDYVRFFWFGRSTNNFNILSFRLASVQRLLRCIVIQWRVLCFMLDTNPLSIFGIERDMVKGVLRKGSKRVLFLGMFFDDLCLSSLQRQCLVLLSRINNNSLHFRKN